MATATAKTNGTTATATKTVQKPAAKEKESVSVSYNINPSMTKEQGIAAIAKLVSAGKALRTLAHETVCGILLHYEAHGDYTLIQRENDKAEPRLLEAIEMSMSRSMSVAFRDWVVANSSLRWDDDKKRFRHNKNDKRIPTGKKGFFNYPAMDGGNEFFNFERDPAPAIAMDKEAILKIIANAANRLLKLQAENAAVTDKAVRAKLEADEVKRLPKKPHQLDDKLVTDLLTFAKGHGLKIDDGKVVIG